MTRGIRFRITAVATTVVVGVLLVTGVALVISQRRVLTEHLEETLARRNQEIAASIRAGSLADPVPGQGDIDAVAQVVDDDGRVLAATANLQGNPPLPAPSGRDEMRTVDLPLDEAPFRIWSRRFDTANGTVVIHTGALLDDVEESVAALQHGLAIAVPAVALVMAALVWWLVGRTLRPVEAIRAQVSDITGTNLHRRVPEPATGDEIAQLAHTMNGMLDRVESAVERQQRFVADASHEVRSPLARIRSEIEVDVGHPETADVERTQRSVLEEIRNLQRLLDDLLLLARSDGGDLITRSQPIDLDDLVLRQVEQLRTETTVPVDLSRVSAAQVVGDRDQLGRAIRNLCENAARHARTEISLSVRELDGVAELVVADDGPGVPADEQQRVFERFARLDDARTDTDGGTGLGLAITRDIIERHGGTIGIDPDAAGARFVISIPTRQ